MSGNTLNPRPGDPRVPQALSLAISRDVQIDVRGDLAYVQEWWVHPEAR